MSRKLTTEEFINRSHLIHGDKYDYSSVDYVNSRTKVNIICKIHGIFKQNPRLHLLGCGCSKCYDFNRESVTSFCKRSSYVHNNKYSYQNVKYINNYTEVEIICPFHGSFFQKPKKHLSGAGCKECLKDKLKISYSEFVSRSNKIHNNKYDYSKVVYVNARTPVSISCNLHGVFLQTPYKHLVGQGCPACAKCKKLNTTEFLNKAELIHNDTYDYSLTVYKNMIYRVEIICKIHGSFFQLPLVHLKGSGCPLCAGGKISKSSQKWLDSLNVPLKNREVTIYINDRIYIVDAYIKETNTIYEYFGFFWHGHPDYYDPNSINPKNKRKFGLLYTDTVNRITNIEKAGFNLVYKWGK